MALAYPFLILDPCNKSPADNLFHPLLGQSTVCKVESKTVILLVT